MSRKTRLMAAIEAINFQTKNSSQSKLYSDLIAEIGRVRIPVKENPDYLDELIGYRTDIEQHRFAEIIKKHTNLNVKVEIDPMDTLDAYVMVSMVDKNNPLLVGWRAFLHGNEHGVSAIRKAGNLTLKGKIDLEHGKVDGYFATVPSTIYLSTGLFYLKMLSNEEIAAIILHEVGHIYSGMEYIGYQYKQNAILMTTIFNFFKTEVPKERELLLKEYTKQSGKVEIENIKDIRETTNPEALQTVLLSVGLDTKRSAQGNPVYDMRTYEQLADDFASRHGAAKALATGLSKLFKESSWKETNSPFFHVVIESVSLLKGMGSVAIALGLTIAGSVGASPLLVGIGAISLFTKVVDSIVDFFGSSSYNYSLYDTPKQRIGNIRRQLVEAIKSRGISDNVKKVFIEDLKVIEEVESSLHENLTFYEKIWSIISSTNRQIDSAIAVQKQLEELASNKLYVSSVKLNIKGV